MHKVNYIILLWLVVGFIGVVFIILSLFLQSDEWEQVAMSLSASAILLHIAEHLDSLIPIWNRSLGE